MQEPERGGPLEALDSKLTIYALANGVDLVREGASRRALRWFRDGLEREISLTESGGVLSLTVRAWPTREEDASREETAESGLALDEAAARLSALLDGALERANAL